MRRLGVEYCHQVVADVSNWGVCMSSFHTLIRLHMTFNSKILKGVFVLILAVLASSRIAVAQGVAQMGTTDLKNEASALVDEKRYIEARPYIVELIKRISDSDDKNLKKELEQMYYFEAFGYLQEYNSTPSNNLMEKAIAGFDKVLENYPNGQYAESAIRTKASCYDALNNLEKAMATRELLLNRPYVDKLNHREQYVIVKQIAERLYNNRKWDIGQKWFERMLNMATLPEDKVFAAAGLIQCAITKKDYDTVKKYFPYMVYDAPARSDIALNYALLLAGDDLAKKEKFSDASVFYSMVLSRDTIVANLKRFLDKAQKQLDRISKSSPDSPAAQELSVKVATYDAMVKAMEGVEDYTADLMARNARNYMLTERDFESFWSYWQMLKTFPDHQSIEDFYMAAIVGAYKIGKDDIMFELCQEYLKKHEEGNYVKDVQLQVAQYYLRKKDYPAFFQLAKKFIAENPDEGQFSADFIFLMGKTWLDMQKYSELTKTFEKYAKENPDTAISEGCMYWSGIAYLAMGDFKNAMRVLVKMIDEFPNGQYAEDGMYRRGVAAFGAGDFNVARDTLEDFINRYSDSQLRGEVEFFLGDIYANNAEIELAMKHYKQVENYTKNQSFIDNAYVQAAKLLHNLERYGEEISLMDAYLERFPKGICSTAIYNKAKALELMGMPADALALYREAIEKYGANKLDDGVDKMVLDYDRMYTENEVKLKATVEFLKKLLVDKELLQNMVAVPAKRYRYFQDNPKIDRRLYEKFKRDKAFDERLYKDKTTIKNLLDQYSLQIANYPKGGVEKVFNEMIEKAKDAKNNTLAYRLMMGLDASGKKVGGEKMFNEDDIKGASVRTLVWIGKVNEKYGAEHARKAFTEAMDREEYEYLIDAMFGSAQLEQRLAVKGQGKWEDVIKLYEGIEDQFPSDPRAAEAVLRKAEVLTKLGKRDQAIKYYEQILKSPSWRGEAYAEALYRLGLIAQHDKKIDAAIMYFDRCYLGYANCYKWTGKALLAAAQLHVARGETGKAKEICDEFIDNKLNEQSPDYAEIKQYRKTL